MRTRIDTARNAEVCAKVAGRRFLHGDFLFHHLLGRLGFLGLFLFGGCWGWLRHGFCGFRRGGGWVRTLRLYGSFRGLGDNGFYNSFGRHGGGLVGFGSCFRSLRFCWSFRWFGWRCCDGLYFGGLFAWPGAIHEGNGEALPLVDIRANQEQREALLKIMSGQDTEPGATFFQVFFSTLTTVHEPRFVPIRFAADLEKRTAQFIVDGLVEARAEPIRNPVTGVEQRARLVLPDGFEYTEAELASSTVMTRSGSPVKLEWKGRHAHLARLDITGQGVVRAA